MEEIKKEYMRYKEILSKVSDADDTSMEAQILRNCWDTKSLETMQSIVSSYEDQGILLTMRRAD